MKSHVRENIAKNIIAANFKEKPVDGGKIIEVSAVTKDIMKSMTPNIEYKDWFVSDDGVWCVKARDKRTDKENIIQGSSMSDCINFAREVFNDGEETNNT